MANTNTKISSNTIHASVNLARYEASARSKIRNMLNKLRRELVTEVADAPKSIFTMSRLRQLLKAVDAAIDATYLRISEEFDLQIDALIKIQIKVAAKVIDDAIGVSMVDTSFSAAQFKTLRSNLLIDGANFPEWWERQAKSTKNKFADNMRQGILKGETVSQLIQRVRAEDGPLFTKAYRDAESLVRSAVQVAANDTRLAIYEKNDDLFDGIQWLATLDNHTSQICRGLDGLVWDNDYEPVGHKIPFPGPTAHPGCRSTQVPVLKSWDKLIKNKELAKKLNKAEKDNPGTRASVDGQVSAKQTYEEWLKKQSVDTQKDILGVDKYKLWKKEKLSLVDMVDQSGQPLTIEELEDLL